MMKDNEKNMEYDFSNVQLKGEESQLIQLNQMNELKYKAEMLVQTHAAEVKDMNEKVAELLQSRESVVESLFSLFSLLERRKCDS